MVFFLCFDQYFSLKYHLISFTFVLVKKTLMFPLLNACCRLHPPPFFSVPLIVTFYPTAGFFGVRANNENNTPAETVCAPITEL